MECQRVSTADRRAVGVHQHVLFGLQHRDQRCVLLRVCQVIGCDRTVFCPFRVFVNWQRSEPILSTGFTESASSRKNFDHQANMFFVDCSLTNSAKLQGPKRPLHMHPQNWRLMSSPSHHCKALPWWSPSLVMTSHWHGKLLHHVFGRKHHACMVPKLAPAIFRGVDATLAQIEMPAHWFSC